MTIPICPRCGKDNGTYAKARPIGSAVEYFDEEGESDGIEASVLMISIGVDYRPSKTVRCSGCDKIRRDLIVINDRVAER